MAEQDSAQEKTEQPSAKRLDDARQKGQVPRSQELNTVMVLIASAVAMLFIGKGLVESLGEVMTLSMTFERKHIFMPGLMIAQLWMAVKIMAFDLGLFLAVTMIAALTAPVFIGGWNFSAQAMGVKPEKLSPIKGLKRIFGPQGLVELGKAFGKFLLVGFFGTLILWGMRDQLLTLGKQEVIPAMAELGYLVVWGALAICASLILIVMIDVPFQKWNHQRQLKMTKQEVKDEHKETDGSPEVKGRIRRMQIQLSQARMMQDVPNADVIITNPTHYAVALRYDQSKSGAPILVAKGADLMAQQIRMVGQHHEVPVLSAPPLTRAIYYNTEIGEEIPAGLYIALAQVLAFVFQLRRYQNKGGSKPHLNPEDLPIPDEFKREE